MIIYTDKCMSCRYKEQWRIVRNYARANNEKIEIRRTTLKPEWQIEAGAYEQLGFTLPFAVVDDEVKDIKELS